MSAIVWITLAQSLFRLWLLGCLANVAQDVFIVSVVRIWLKYIVVTSAAAEGIRSLHAALKIRAGRIMRRSVGIRRHAGLVHHFKYAYSPKIVHAMV